GEDPQAAVECASESRERDLRRDGSVEHPDDERHREEHQQAADAVHAGGDRRGGPAVSREVAKGMDVAEFGPLLCDLGHGMTFVVGCMRGLCWGYGEPKIVL